MSLVSERPCKEYPFDMIRRATDDFDESKLIGKGGFGKVYKGMLYTRWNMTDVVAVKRLKPGSKQGVQQFHTEIKMLSMGRHSHLVTLMGYCNENEEMILGYEYMSGGNLATQLFTFPNSGLRWNQRLKICIQAARGLHYLHTGHTHKVIHLDVKCANILLDENMDAKVSDLGLSVVISANQDEAITTFMQGTRGYIDPYYRKSHKCSTKTDIYAFGVVLLELLTGKHVTGGWIIPDPDVTDLAKWIQEKISDGTVNNIVDPSIVRQIDPNCRDSFTEIMRRCLHDDPLKRPSMCEVGARLEDALATQTGTHLSSSIMDSELHDYFNKPKDTDSNDGHEVVAPLEYALATQTRTHPSSSIMDDNIDAYFNRSWDTNSDYAHPDNDILCTGTNYSDNLNVYSSTHTNSDDTQEDYNIYSTSINSNDRHEGYNIFSMDANSQPTSRLRTPITESRVNQSRRSTLGVPSYSFIPGAQDLVPKSVIGLLKKTVKRRTRS